MKGGVEGMEEEWRGWKRSGGDGGGSGVIEGGDEE